MLPDSFEDGLVCHGLLTSEDDSSLESVPGLDTVEARLNVQAKRAAIHQDVCCSTHQTFALTHGLFIKCRAACARVVKKNLFRPPADAFAEAGRFVKLLYHLTRPEDRILLIGAFCEGECPMLAPLTPMEIFLLSEESLCKSLNLSPALQREFNSVPFVVVKNTLSLQQPTADCSVPRIRMDFPRDFVAKVSAYMDSVNRPVATRAAAICTDSQLTVGFEDIMSRLSSLPREECPECGSHRSLYCGPCGGARLPAAHLVLPPRVSLPYFELVLVLHPAESLRHCTGIHAAVMGQRERVTVINWPRSRDREKGETGSGVWDAFLDNFDHLTDVMLFPDEKSALTVTEYVSVGNSWLGKRVVVLEASWNNSKAMFRQIQEGFVRRGQSPLKAIMLQNLTGTYWKFHHEGKSAVSTIEAIVHLLGEVACATDGAFDVEQFPTLLWLFEYDRHRLLSRLKDGQGKVPRTVEVRGTGIGSWKSYIS